MSPWQCALEGSPVLVGDSSEGKINPSTSNLKNLGILLGLHKNKEITVPLQST